MERTHDDRKPQRPRDPAEKSHELAELVEKFRFGMLVSVATGGELRARPMTIIERSGVTTKSDDANGRSRLTFATGLDNALVDELQSAPNVCVTLQDGYQYVSLTCTAHLDRDQQRIREIWTNGLELWFPDGPDDPRVVLVDCDVTHAEFWDVSGFERMRYAVEAGRAYLQDDSMDPRRAGKHAELSGEELRR